MTRRWSIALVVAALALAGLVSCSSGGSGSGTCPSKVDTKTVTGGAITVCAADIKFDVVTIKARPGPLTVTLVNRGAVFHTFKIKDTALYLSTNPGKSDTGTVTLSKGTYDFECTVPGHAQAGMKGKIEVG
jgi:plastocyanin